MNAKHRRCLKAKRGCTTSKSTFSKMSCNLESHSHCYIHWKIKRSDMNASTSIESPTFNFLGVDIKLQLAIAVGLTVKIYINQDIIFGGIHFIETYFMDKNGVKRNSITNGEINANRKFGEPFLNEIWSMDYNDFFATAEFLFAHTLNVVCIITRNNVECCCQNGQGKTDPTLKEFSLEKLSHDVFKLYNNGERSDATLTCGDETIPVSKTILSARSDVFAAMFRNQMAESIDGIVDIPDIQFPILDRLLRYIYSGKLDEMIGDTALQLYEAADKYGVETLKCRCASILFQELTEDNACDILLLADMHSDQNFKKDVISFIQMKKEFLRTNQWAEFSKKNPSLAVEVYDTVFRQLQLA